MEHNFSKKIDLAYKSVYPFINTHIRIGIILGSGWGDFISELKGSEIPYSKISSFPQPTVRGHPGVLKISSPFAVMAGRFHFYEGFSMDDIVAPVFFLEKLGVQYLIITNAAGGINRRFKPSDVVLIKDHINLMGANPLSGNDTANIKTRFTDMSEAYSLKLRKMIRNKLDISLDEGVYAAMPGPSYETPAEIRMLERIGADMVGMSTVPEVIAAAALGIEVIGLSSITNLAAGIQGMPLNHEEVLSTGKKMIPRLKQMIFGITDLLKNELSDEE